MGVRSAPDVAGDDVDPVGHYGAGVKYFVNRHLALRLDVRHVIAAQAAQQADGTSHLEVLAGLSLTLGRGKKPAAAPDSAPPDPDRDHDGFTNVDDRCPDEPGVAPDGCPDRDSDGDSILDSVDACPAVPGVAPTGCPPADRDRDGILDG
ncbi:MAG: thrombospondin type 3 repeat-containing protein, partial [Myxococcales bacterium]|nr:thrombospondin type 3 repeat-containing protein [Myxococcales bacterium]